MSSIKFIDHPTFFHPYYLLLSHLHYKLWKKNSDIIKGDRDNNEGVLHYEIGFKLLGDNIKVFY